MEKMKIAEILLVSVYTLIAAALSFFKFIKHISRLKTQTA
jgi:hypothetical protein